MNSSESKDLIERIEETSRVTQELIQRVSDIRLMIRELDSHARAKKLDEEGLYRPGRRDRIIIAIARTYPDPLWDALNQIRQKNPGFPSIIFVQREDATSVNAKRVAYAAKSILGERRDANVLVLTWAHHLQPFTNSESIVLGRRYLRITDEKMRTLRGGLQEIGITVYSDEGLYGGGRITHDLMSVMDETQTQMIMEVTVPLGYSYNEYMLKGILSAILDLEVG